MVIALLRDAKRRHLHDARHAGQHRAAEKLDPNLSLLYTHWAMLLFKQEKYQDAWQMAGKSKKLGGEDLDPEFVKAVEGEAGKPLPKI